MQNVRHVFENNILKEIDIELTKGAHLSLEISNIFSRDYYNNNIFEHN